MKKQTYWNATMNHLSEKMAVIENALKDTQDAANSDTKSSAGDKHETSRAMAHIENERLASQLKVLQNQVETLQKINPTIVGETIKFGSLVSCEDLLFFMSIGLGKIQHDSTDFFAIAANSPVGKSLIGKKVGETILIGNKKTTITYVE